MKNEQNGGKKRPSLKLEVLRASEEDAGKGIARLHNVAMQALNLVNGDYIEIIGGKRTVAIVWVSQNATFRRAGLAIDGEIRSNAGCGIDDQVLVRKANVVELANITLRPITAGTLNNPELILARKLRGRPIRRDQVIRVDLIGNSVSFVVMATEPDAIGLVTFLTEVHVEEISQPEPSQVVGDEQFIQYEDIGGLSREIGLIREMVELPLRYPQLFARLGIDPPKGVLLYGPPGTGKTLLAKAVAREVDAHFISLSGPEVMSKYYGDSEKRIREIFEEAREKSPSIIFIDEIDSIAPKRKDTFGEVERRVTAQILTMMDGLGGRGQVIVIAATNLPDALDPALRRGGRFDREIEIGIPDRSGRLEIYHVHTRTMPLAEDVNLIDYAESSYGFVGADIALHCKEAAMHASRSIMEQMKRGEEIDEALIDQIVISDVDFRGARSIVHPSGMRELYVEIPEISWDNVAGLEKIKYEIEKIVEWPIKRADIFSELHIRPSKGILLFGPPGTGKTLLARAIAAKTRRNFISVKGPELLSKLVGDSEKQVREAFRKARQSAPSIIFFDEIDSLVAQRGQGMNSKVNESILSQILTEIDGLEELKGVIIIAATNRPDMLDPALLRTGRLERHLYVPPPNAKERYEILRLYTQSTEHLFTEDVDLREIAESMRFFVGADIEAFVQQVKIAGLDMIEINENADDSFPLIQITRAHIDSVLLHMRGTLENQML
jgi:transitional endoplasmic reticulum ATPase